LVERIREAGTPPVRDLVLGFGEERIAFRLANDFGVEELYAPRRYLLDSILIEAAVDGGVEFMSATRMTGLHTDHEGRVTGVDVSRAGSSSTVRARIVIGADGVWSRVAEIVGAPTSRSHPPTNAVHYAYYSGLDSPGWWFQFTPGVNAGLITTNDGAVCVFVGRPRRLMPRFKENPEQEFLRLLRMAGADLAERAEAGTRISPFRGTPGLPGFLRRPFGPGWALVGDAGYTKDPISAHGISDALRDAELCARAVDRSLRHPAEELEAMQGYQQVRDRLSHRMFDESDALARFEWDPEEASRRMRGISEAVRIECDAIVALPDWPGVITSGDRVSTGSSLL